LLSGYSVAILSNLRSAFFSLLCLVLETICGFHGSRSNVENRSVIWRKLMNRKMNKIAKFLFKIKKKEVSERKKKGEKKENKFR
jgi:hypothetical protein